MIVRNTSLPGVCLIDFEPAVDERGLFARVWCRREFVAAGLCGDWVQSGISRNARKGTLRGMHYQVPPYAEIKLVRCIRGAIYDVVLDLRKDSITYKGWVAVELTDENHQSLYIPQGCAHGFLTLQDDTEVLYTMSEFYHPESARGVRWDDPVFGVAWPESHSILSKRDRTFPDFIP